MPIEGQVICFATGFVSGVLAAAGVASQILIGIGVAVISLPLLWNALEAL